VSEITQHSYFISAFHQMVSECSAAADFVCFARVLVLRWDFKIRKSTVSGVVGAGAVGLDLNITITQFY
jgi:hypothetical protein